MEEIIEKLESETGIVDNTVYHGVRRELEDENCLVSSFLEELLWHCYQNNQKIPEGELEKIRTAYQTLEDDIDVELPDIKTGENPQSAIV